MFLDKDFLKQSIQNFYYWIYDLFDFRGKILLEKNGSLYNKHKGERIFLLGTGESLTHINLLDLKNELTFGTNLIFLYKDLKKLNLNYFLLLDSYRKSKPQFPKDFRFDLKSNHKEEVYRRLGELIESDTVLFLPSVNEKHIEKNIKYNKKYYLKASNILSLNSDTSIQKNFDLLSRSICGLTSLYSSISVLMYMGFEEIYLCGQGYTYDPEYILHFYDNIKIPKNACSKSQAENEIKSIIEKRRLRGGRIRYGGILEKDNYYRAICIRNKSYDKSTIEHNLINDFALSNGVRILNIVPNGFKSPFYESISWGEIKKIIN